MFGLIPVIVHNEKDQGLKLQANFWLSTYLAYRKLQPLKEMMRMTDNSKHLRPHI